MSNTIPPLDLNETEVKKLVYKQKPKATFERIRMGVAYYTFDVAVSDDMRIGFNLEIPVSDMGGADFTQQMEAKHLLRWLDINYAAYMTDTKNPV